MKHKHAIQVLEKEAYLVKGGLKSWGDDYPEQKKRQEDKLKEIGLALLILRNIKTEHTLQVLAGSNPISKFKEKRHKRSLLKAAKEITK